MCSERENDQTRRSIVICMQPLQANRETLWACINIVNEKPSWWENDTAHWCEGPEADVFQNARSGLVHLTCDYVVSWHHHHAEESMFSSI